MKPGLYDHLLTSAIEEEIARLAIRVWLHSRRWTRRVTFDSGSVLGRLIASSLALHRGSDAAEKQRLLVERIVETLTEVLSVQKSDGFSIATPLQRLLAIHRTVDTTTKDRPDSPLSRSSLFTGTRLDASLGSQLRKEIATCDRVDILCSFIKWSGLRVLHENLRELSERSAGDGPVIRVITTSYMGATDPKAVEVLRELPRTEVRVSYDTKRTGCMRRLICFIEILASVAPTLDQRTCRTRRCLKDSNGLPKSASTNCRISGTR